jgi:adenosylcobinamide kinase/adenosylcobinamide-phosphate guanylyltransferase
MAAMLVVLLGGARSGKSACAEALARRHDGAVTYIATAPHIAGDDDLEARIARHRAERPAHWTTVEDELDLAGALVRAGDAVAIVDCVTTWIGNLMFHGRVEAEVMAAADAAIAVAASRPATTIVVSNEVGMGIVPADQSSRTYRDLLGRVNQRWVAAADRALLLVAGKAIALHDTDELVR